MELLSTYTSLRTFLVYSYAAGHGLLLLRSRKANDFPTRVDILFQDVRALEMRAWFSGLDIEEVQPEFLAGRKSDPLQLMEPGNKIYRVGSTGWEGFILGGIVSIHEDEEEYAAPSFLLTQEHMSREILTTPRAG